LFCFFYSFNTHTTHPPSPFRFAHSYGVLIQFVVHTKDGKTLTVATDDSWEALDADAYYHPHNGANWYKHKLEFTDARDEPVGWRTGVILFRSR
jgi:hypothetical protein